MADGSGLTQPYRTDPLIAPGFPLDHVATPEAALALHDTTDEQHFLGRAGRRNVHLDSTARG